MGCLFALVAGLFPRVALVLVWLLTNLVDRAYDTFVIPLLGLFLLPFTTLVYALVWAPGVGVDDGRWLWVAMAFLVELVGYVGSRRSSRGRARR